ncbi:MAG TPA: hypothetical protein VFV17_00940, partial [Usitatibacteraceae bacterium]|nr:hypothetical protein [Usitatibacteraceae bacterium]
MSFAPRIVARCLIALLAAAAGSAWIPASAAVEYKIAADSEKGTNFVIGTDLAKFVAPAAGFKLSVLATAGSAANLRLLRYDPAVKLAIVQADVYRAFAAQSAAGNSEAAEVMRGSRIVMPL